MARRSLVTLAAALSLAALAIPGRAQEPPKPEAAPRPEAVKASDDRLSERPCRSGPTVRVGLVIARYQGEKKVASLPYTLVVGTGGPTTRMRMGVDTPIPVTSFTRRSPRRSRVPRSQRPPTSTRPWARTSTARSGSAAA